MAQKYLLLYYDNPQAYFHSNKYITSGKEQFKYQIPDFEVQWV